jgi:glutaminyl-tRNA synthetase
MGNSDEIFISKFVALGFNEQKGKETLKNAALTKNITAAFSLLENKKKKVEELPKGAGTLIYHLCSKIKPQSVQQIDLLVSLIADNKLDNILRVDLGLEFVLTHSVSNSAINVADLEKHCGVNVRREW